MGSLEVVIFIVALLLICLGVIMIFDARIISKKFFSFGDQNESTLGLKIAGFIIMVIGAGIIIFI